MSAAPVLKLLTRGEPLPPVSAHAIRELVALLREIDRRHMAGPCSEWDGHLLSRMRADAEATLDAALESVAAQLDSANENLRAAELLDSEIRWLRVRDDWQDIAERAAYLEHERREMRGWF